MIDCLRIQRVQPELHRVGNGDEYWQLLRDRWETGEEFFIVEQDVIHVGHTFSADDMAKAGRDVEKSVLSRALALVLSERVFV